MYACQRCLSSARMFERGITSQQVPETLSGGEIVKRTSGAAPYSSAPYFGFPATGLTSMIRFPDLGAAENEVRCLPPRRDKTRFNNPYA